MLDTLLQVLHCSKALRVWAGGQQAAESFGDLISRDADITQVPNLAQHFQKSSLKLLALSSTSALAGASSSDSKVAFFSPHVAILLHAILCFLPHAMLHAVSQIFEVELFGLLQVVQALAGAVEASTAGVAAFLGGFDSFSFLWQLDIATEHAKFLASSPKLEVVMQCLSSLHFITLYFSLLFNYLFVLFFTTFHYSLGRACSVMGILWFRLSYARNVDGNLRQIKKSTCCLSKLFKNSMAPSGKISLDAQRMLRSNDRKKEQRHDRVRPQENLRG